MLALYWFMVPLAFAAVPAVLTAFLVQRLRKRRALTMTAGVLALAVCYAGLLAWGGAPDF